MRAFETVIEAKKPDYDGRICYLEQHAFRKQEVVRSCFFTDRKEGYKKAK